MKRAALIALLGCGTLSGPLGAQTVASSGSRTASTPAATPVRAPEDTSAVADSVQSTPGPTFWNRVGDALRLSGTATLSTDLYAAQGIDARRPGAAWRMSFSPQASAPGGFSMGVDVLLSSEGNHLRQNMSQLGISPRWSWGTLHVGDFSQTFTPYTINGLRLRGGGIDLSPGGFRFALQGGRAQRVVSASSAPVYQRMLFGARVGYGDDADSHFIVSIVKGKDDVNSLEQQLLLPDSVLADTLSDFMRPRIETRPQENLVLGAAGQLRLFEAALTLRGEVAGALITHDLTSPRVKAERLGAFAFLDPLHPVHLSTSGDMAWNVGFDLRTRRGSLQGGYEVIGAGYTSLGLPYLIADREKWTMGGSTHMLGGRVMLQTQVQHENDNLLDQRASTTNRDMGTVTLALRPLNTLAITLSAVGNRIANDAAVDTFRVDAQTVATNASVALRLPVLGRDVSWALSHSYQQSADRNTLHDVPQVDVHNLSGSVTVEVLTGVSVTPSVSLVSKQVENEGNEQSVFANFRGQATLFDGRLRTGGTVSRTFSQGREVLSLLANATVSLPWESALTLQARHNDYGAWGSRPAFQEQFITLSLSRTF